MTPERGPVSPLFLGFADALSKAAQCGPVADLAAGRGRHALASARLGLTTIAVDRSRALLSELRTAATRERAPVVCVEADLEAEQGLPFGPSSCGAILVFRYLHRPLCPQIAHALAPGGLLLYETFTVDQRELGSGPRNPAFLLERGELPSLFPDLEVLSHLEGWNDDEGNPCEKSFQGLAGSATAQLAARAPVRA